MHSHLPLNKPAPACCEHHQRAPKSQWVSDAVPQNPGEWEHHRPIIGLGYQCPTRSLAPLPKCTDPSAHCEGNQAETATNGHWRAKPQVVSSKPGGWER